MKDIKNIVSFLSHTFQYLDKHPEIVDEIIKGMSTVQIEPKKDNNSSASISIVNVDIYEIYKLDGIEGLRNELNKLSIENLKEIIKKYRLDPKKYFYKWKTSEKFISFIVDKVQHKIDKGKNFIAEDSKLQQNEKIDLPNK
ncbi:MAG: hypothetical protein U9N34_07045 [Candidatus Cloacimonadota bacterium]|nr:hypothetical protein [Candidatus Cloacimonadota bacterium]